MGEQLDRFLYELCNRRNQIQVIFTLAIVLLVLQVPYLITVDRGTALFVVSVLNVGGFSAFAAGSGAVLWFCRQRRRRR